MSSSQARFSYTTNLSKEDSDLLQLYLKDAWIEVGIGKIDFPKDEFYRFDLTTYKRVIPFTFKWLGEFSGNYEVSNIQNITFFSIFLMRNLLLRFCWHFSRKRLSHPIPFGHGKI